MKHFPTIHIVISKQQLKNDGEKCSVCIINCHPLWLYSLCSNLLRSLLVWRVSRNRFIVFWFMHQINSRKNKAHHIRSPALLPICSRIQSTHEIFCMQMGLPLLGLMTNIIKEWMADNCFNHTNMFIIPYAFNDTC